MEGSGTEALGTSQNVVLDLMRFALASLASGLLTAVAVGAVVMLLA